MAYDIEFGIPLPPANSGHQYGAHVEPIRALKAAPVGSSVVLDAETRAIRQKISTYCFSLFGKGGYAVRSVAPGKVRVWKIA